MPKQTFFNLPEEKRQRLLQLAIEEFAENDYKNASLSNIVARAGIAKGSLYQYFEDKRALYFYLLELATEEKKRFLARATPPDPTMNLFDFLRWLVREGAQFELSQPKLAQVAYRALFGDRPFGEEAFAEVKKAATGYYENLIQLGIAQGAIDPNINREMAVFVLSTVFNEFGRFLIEQKKVNAHDLVGGQLDKAADTVAVLADQLINLLEYGLAVKLKTPDGES